MRHALKLACVVAVAHAFAAGCGDVRREPITGPKSEDGGNSKTDGEAARPHCASNDDCAPRAPKCDLSSGECGPCALDADCGATAPRCDVGSGACVECVARADCPKNACPGATTCSRPEAVLCDLTQHRCVECVTDGHCSSVGERCSSVLGVCATPCTTRAVCPPDENICDTDVGFCVECIVDVDCPPERKFCRRSECTP